MIDLEAIRQRNEAAKVICAEDGCADPAHFGPRRDIDTLFGEIERLNEALMVAIPDPIERAYVKAAPETVRKYLARSPSGWSDTLAARVRSDWPANGFSDHPAFDAARWLLKHAMHALVHDARGFRCVSCSAAGFDADAVWPTVEEWNRSGTEDVDLLR